MTAQQSSSIASSTTLTQFVWYGIAIYLLYAASVVPTTYAILVPQNWTLLMTNDCPYNLGVAVASNTSTGYPSGEGLILAPQLTYLVYIPLEWSGYVWARQGCSWVNAPNFHCQIGDCGTQGISCKSSVTNDAVTFFHIGPTDKNGSVDLSIDLTYGFNVPVAFSTDTEEFNPISGSCLANFTANCPQELRGATNDQGVLQQCWNSCHRSGSPNCSTTSPNAIPYYDWFHSGCPNATITPTDSAQSIDSLLAVNLTFCPNGVFDIAAPANDFASVSTSAFASTTATSSGSGSSTTGSRPSSSSAGKQTRGMSTYVAMSVAAGIVIGLAPGIMVA